MIRRFSKNTEIKWWHTCHNSGKYNRVSPVPKIDLEFPHKRPLEKMAVMKMARLFLSDNVGIRIG